MIAFLNGKLVNMKLCAVTAGLFLVYSQVNSCFKKKLLKAFLFIIILGLYISHSMTQKRWSQ